MLIAVPPLSAQQQVAELRRWVAPALDLSGGSGVAADSVRVQVGYQQWRGAAIGGGIGLAVGLLAVAIAGEPGVCADCSRQPSWGHNAVVAGLLVGGAGGVIGFLSGLATPRYQLREEAQP